MTEKPFMSPGISFTAMRGRSPAALRPGALSGMVAITRGGLVPAAIVARELDMRIIDTFCVASYAREKIQAKSKF